MALITSTTDAMLMATPISSRSRPPALDPASLLVVKMPPFPSIRSGGAGIRDRLHHLREWQAALPGDSGAVLVLSLIHISEPTRLGMISYAVFCLKKKKK